ncbi:amastin-like surface protein-like protein [Trypanosoma theileri]|uniref:Amastin-like surface protein-like protein n=1 Tax=Trypanosoma theileri TaxID=67003 RepID=A0A1X0NQ58_9TRYP|nr:amastin-like surface protein-like protein [Trypanosoma theileri]ORC86593.1 amastin-like surface protein-like protein [Trypanosoma theileri]
MKFGLGLIPLVVEAIVFLFVLIATPLEMFRLDVLGGDSCITLWGARKCSSTKYSSRSFQCDRQRNTMRAGAAFAIISIFFTLVCVFMIFLKDTIKIGSFVAKVCAIVSVCTILIAWATAAGVYHQKMCKILLFELPSYKNDGWKLGAGFGLMVTAWCLQVINAVLCFILWRKEYEEERG